MTTPMPTEIPTVIRSTSTGLLATEVQALGRNHIWIHRLGTQATLPFSSSVIELDDDANTELLVIGRGTGSYRSYETPASSTMFELLETGDSSALKEAGRQWGMALNALHSGRLTHQSGNTTAPRTMQRANAWLAGGWKPACDVLGEQGLTLIHRWADRMLTCPRPVPVHGHPGMAHWVVTPDGRNGKLLSGEDTGLAHPDYDFGWVLGEITELYAFRPEMRPALDTLRSGLLECYGRLPPASALAAARAFRLTQHAYDWHRFAGATVEQASLLLQLAATHLRPYFHDSQEPT